MNLFDAHKDQLKLKQPVRLFEAFSGIGTQAMALKRLGVEIEHVGISEIDKYALASYKAIHGDVKNYGNIMDIQGSDLPQIDIFTWSFPCTDLSKAGKQKGLYGGTRSGLGYQVVRIIGEMKIKPKVLLMENVPDLLSHKFREGWQEIYHDIEKLGYSNYVETLNAKNYGVAQNRDRVFMVSILGDYSYTFPIWVKLEKRLKDYLEDEVDEKYYLSEKQLTAINNPKYESMGIDRIPSVDDDTANAITTSQGGNREPKVILEPKCLNSKVNGKQPSLQDRVYDTEEISTAITTSYMPSISIPEATKQGYALAKDGDGVYINRPHQKRGVVQDGMIQTIKTSGDDVGVVVLNPIAIELRKDEGIRYFEDNVMETLRTIQYCGDKGVIDNLRIRKLTPLECWRLMGISDDDFYKAQAVVSNSQLYKQAGNGIVVDVLMAIFGKML